MQNARGIVIKAEKKLGVVVGAMNATYKKEQGVL